MRREPAIAGSNGFIPNARQDLAMLGVCYYPEDWPEAFWAEDARRMRELGIAFVRIGEFAWSRLEPRRGEFHWDWLDRAFEALGGAGLKIVLGTPTAAPPKWLMDDFSDIAPVDKFGRTRGFGSRRHYTFSSPAYARATRRSSTAQRGSSRTRGARNLMLTNLLTTTRKKTLSIRENVLS
jgi:beta-galactosidase GanA